MSGNGKTALLAAFMLSLPSCGNAAQPAGSLTSVYAQLETPPGRETPAMSADEQKKLREELTKARDRQSDRMKTKKPAPVSESKKR